MILAIAAGGVACAEVVRPAPQINFPTVDGHARTLKSFSGQPVIVLLADSPNRGAFETQVKEMEKSFDRLAARKTVIAAAFKNNIGEVRSGMPVVILPDGPAACDAFPIKGKFSIAIIGPDGNLDYLTDKILNINRILEVMKNSFEIQKAAHR